MKILNKEISLDKIDWWILIISFFTGHLIKFNDLISNDKHKTLLALIVSISISLLLSVLFLVYKKVVVKHRDAVEDLRKIQMGLTSSIEDLKKEIINSNNVIKEELLFSNELIKCEIEIAKSKLDFEAKKIKEFNKDTINLFFQNNPFGYFTKNNSHTGVIGSLIEESLTNGFTKLTAVSGMKYLKFIKEAIKNTVSFCGVNKKSLRFFIEGNPTNDTTNVPQEDIETFNDHFSYNMANIFPRRRIFILPDDEISKMEKDILDPDIFNKFFEISRGIQTFWISEKELLSEINKEKEYRLNGSTIFDFGIYHNLIIKYSYEFKELDYKEITSNDDEYKIYSFFSNIIKTHGNFKPFKPIFIFDNGNCFFKYENEKNMNDFFKSKIWKERIRDSNFLLNFINPITV
jgi:hypothetical protein